MSNRSNTAFERALIKRVDALEAGARELCDAIDLAAIVPEIRHHAVLQQAYRKMRELTAEIWAN